MLRSTTHGATSIIKTSLLRQDRVTRQTYEQRLAICANCPGGHATFNHQGKLHTCGPMLQSMKDAGLATCGCVLSAKARDTKETCPFGYWPQPQADQVQPCISLPLLNVQARLNPLPALFDLSRRRFMQGAAAAVAGMLVAPGDLWARNPEEKCWFKVKPCEGGDSKWILCDAIKGNQVRDTFKNIGEGGDGKCYKVSSNHTDKEPSGNILAGNADFTECEGCPSDYECGECQFDENATVDIEGLGSYECFCQPPDCSAPCSPYGDMYWYEGTLEFQECNNGWVVFSGTVLAQTWQDHQAGLVCAVRPDPEVIPPLEEFPEAPAAVSYNCATGKWWNGDAINAGFYARLIHDDAQLGCEGYDYSLVPPVCMEPGGGSGGWWLQSHGTLKGTVDA